MVRDLSARSRADDVALIAHPIATLGTQGIEIVAGTVINLNVEIAGVEEPSQTAVRRIAPDRRKCKGDEITGPGQTEAVEAPQ